MVFNGSLVLGVCIGNAAAEIIRELKKAPAERKWGGVVSKVIFVSLIFVVLVAGVAWIT